MMEVDEALDELEEWQLVGDAYYSRRQLYSLDWAGGGGGGSGGAFNLAFMRIFPAAAGGPVAALRDDTKLVLYVGAASRPDIQILTA
ncbi:Vacuolar sorting-associated 16, partial [Micractinium conductrix]